MSRSAKTSALRWLCSVAGRTGALTLWLLLVQSVLALCGVAYALVLRALIDAAVAGLSEGQLQRQAIARAVFCDRPILLLDEATSALDETTEAQLLANLRQMTDKTVLIVTHRPAALAIVDRVVELGDA